MAQKRKHGWGHTSHYGDCGMARTCLQRVVDSNTTTSREKEIAKNIISGISLLDEKIREPRKDK